MSTKMITTLRTRKPVAVKKNRIKSNKGGRELEGVKKKQQFLNKA